MTHSGVETEVKIRIDDADSARKLILAAGFEETKGRIFEANDVFDLPDRPLLQAGELLRVRQTGDVGRVTWKGPATTGTHKSRPEIESGLDDPRAMAEILHRLGYVRVFRYEKYRTEFGSAATIGTITLDETPIGNFLELEGEPGWIDRTAAQLGFDSKGYVTSSYAALFREHSPDAEHMVFP